MLFIFTVISVSFLTLLVQTTILPYFQIAMVKPDLALIIVIYAAVYFEETDAISIGFTFGIVQDSLSYGLFGMYATTNCLTVMVVIILKKIFYSEDFLAGYIIAFIVIVMNAFASSSLVNHVRLGAGDILWGKSLLVLIYNSVLVPPLFFIIRLIHSKYTFFVERFTRI